MGFNSQRGVSNGKTRIPQGTSLSEVDFSGHHRTGENKHLEVEKGIIKIHIFFPKYFSNERKAVILANKKKE